MVSGSLAVNVYTTPRMTRDIDLVISLKGEDVPSFVSAFKDEFYCDPDGDRQIGDILNLIDDSDLDLVYIRYWISKLRLKTFDLPL